MSNFPSLHLIIRLTIQSHRPENREELFNLRHAMLRNAVERIFGIFKRRFPILTRHVQSWLVVGLAVSHNLIMQQGTAHADDFPEGYDERLRDHDIPEDDESPVEDREEHLAWRDNIAEAMWLEYVLYNTSRGRRVTHCPREAHIPRRGRSRGRGRKKK